MAHQLLDYAYISRHTQAASGLSPSSKYPPFTSLLGTGFDGQTRCLSRVSKLCVAREKDSQCATSSREPPASPGCSCLHLHCSRFISPRRLTSLASGRPCPLQCQSIPSTSPCCTTEKS